MSHLGSGDLAYQAQALNYLLQCRAFPTHNFLNVWQKV